MIRGAACAVAVWTAVSVVSAQTPVTSLTQRGSQLLDTQVTPRKGNVQGKVPVLMYHRIGPVEKSMVRTYANFRADLERLYKMGFRPVTMTEYANNRMPLLSGASPVVLTFDDSWEEQFRYLPDGSIDPKSFVGVWLDFAKDHPGFPVKATWYVLRNGPFGPKEQAKKKMAQLEEWGGEIASHTLNHPNLRSKSDDVVMAEIGGSYLYLQELGFTPEAFAPPYGVFPRNRQFVRGFNFRGKRIQFSSAVLAGSEPGLSPRDKKFDPHYIPRIQAYPGYRGITWWLNQIEDKKLEVYVQP